MRTYSINFNNHYRVAKTTLLYFFVAILSIVIIISLQVKDSNFIIKTIIFVSLILNGPAIFIHFSYFLENWKLQIKETGKSIEIFKDNSLRLVIDETNIKYIDVFMSRSYINFNIISGLPSEEYNYAHIKTTAGDIMITNLIYPNIKQLAYKFGHINPQFHETIFATT